MLKDFISEIDKESRKYFAFSLPDGCGLLWTVLLLPFGYANALIKYQKGIDIVTAAFRDTYLYVETA
jgi:hypothetical protein